MADFDGGLKYIVLEQEFYKSALEIMRLKQNHPDDLNAIQSIQIEFDVDQQQIRIRAILDAAVEITEKGAELTIKPRPIYDSPQP